MPTCTAFTKNASPCTHNGHTNGLCGYHAPMVATPQLQLKFTRDQARLRARWQAATAAGGAPVPAPAPVPPPVPAAPVAPRPMCGHLKRTGRRCEALAQHPDGKCGLHHAMLIRHGEQRRLMDHLREVRQRHLDRRPPAEIDAYAREAEVGLNPQHRMVLWRHADHYILSPHYTTLRTLILNGADVAAAMGLIDALAQDGLIQRRRELLGIFAEALFHQVDRLPNRAPIPANRREAQLAADTQNVHSAEFSKQMTEAIDMLCAVEVPNTQKATVHEMRDSWRLLGKTESEISVVYRDVTTWWNKDTVYKIGDKLYRKCLRGLWFTIKTYTGETRMELEKRLWDECRDACIPYSVCTQGHLARLSNVMVGFDEAFAQPVAVGEILQQKMSAIAGMDIESEKQIELARALLAELKIPEEKHADWLAAF